MDGPSGKTLGRELFVFTLPDHTSPRRDDTVRVLLEAHLAWEWRRKARANVESALIVASILPVISLIWPSTIPVIVRMLAFIAWTGLLATLVALRVSEYRWCRRMVGNTGGDSR